MDIATWLDRIGLAQYAPAFAEQAIDGDLLTSLDADDLREIGVAPLGHRKRLLNAIAELRAAECRPPPAASGAGGPDDAERRQMTVLFCDLVGATALSQRLDPEALRDLLRRFQRACADAVLQCGGHVAQYLGDGVLAYFGYPLAQGDDARRAVLAGLATLQALRAASSPGLPLQARVGIETGIVVAGEMGIGSGRELHSCVGETPNLAARLQAIAAPDSIVVGPLAHQLTGRHFVCEALGPQPLKGLDGPVPAWRVVGEAAALELEPDRGPLVGREAELGLLLERWQLARNGRGQVVLLGGEAGMGKSRLLRAFRDAAALEATELRVLRCSPQHCHSALHPVLGALERLIGADATTPLETRLARLHARLDALGLPTETAAPLASLWGADVAGEVLSDAQRRQRLFTALGRTLATASAATEAVVLLVEDAHWADASTLDLLGQLIERMATERLFAVVSFRQDFAPPWPPLAQVAQLQLRQLDAEQIAAVVRQRAGARALPAEVMEQLLEKSGGVPLFVEELTEGVIGSGLLVERDGRFELAGEVSALRMPMTLRGSLTVRLDRLAGTRRLAQLASVIGRDFEAAMLAHVADADADTLERGLAELVQRDVLHLQGDPAAPSYRFKHSLLRDAAYESLLKATRQQIHARIAAAFEAHFPHIVASYPEVIALHLAQAGEPARAAPYYLRAGDLARQRAGYTEAVVHFRSALDMLAQLPETTRRQRDEVDLQLRIGVLIGDLQGAHTPAYQATCARALQLAEVLGDVRRRFAATWGLWFHRLVATQTDRALAHTDDLFALARSAGDGELLLEAHHSSWATHLVTGHFGRAQADALEGIARYDRRRHAAHRLTYGGHDTGACACCFAAMCASARGQPALSARLAEQGLDIARSIDDPLVISHALAAAAVAARMRGDAAACRALGDESLAIEHRHAVRQFNILAIAAGGWGHLADGDLEGAGRCFDEVAAQLLAGRTPSSFSAFLIGQIADHECATGRSAAAQARLAAYLDSGSPSRFYDAELLRRLGECHLKQSAGATAEAEALFRSAIEVARSQQAPGFELQARLALARLLLDKGRRDDAAATLAPLIDAFLPTEAPAGLAAARELLQAAG